MALQWRSGADKREVAAVTTFHSNSFQQPLEWNPNLVINKRKYTNITRQANDYKVEAKKQKSERKKKKKKEEEPNTSKSTYIYKQQLAYIQVYIINKYMWVIYIGSNLTFSTYTILTYLGSLLSRTRNETSDLIYR